MLVPGAGLSAMTKRGRHWSLAKLPINLPEARLSIWIFHALLQQDLHWVSTCFFGSTVLISWVEIRAILPLPKRLGKRIWSPTTASTAEPSKRTRRKNIQEKNGNSGGHGYERHHSPSVSMTWEWKAAQLLPVSWLLLANFRSHHNRYALHSTTTFSCRGSTSHCHGHDPQIWPANRKERGSIEILLLHPWSKEIQAYHPILQNNRPITISEVRVIWWNSCWRQMGWSLSDMHPKSLFHRMVYLPPIGGMKIHIYVDTSLLKPPLFTYHYAC